MTNAAIYARLSKEDVAHKGNGEQLDSQIDRANKYCALRELTALPPFTDLDVSGGVPLADRPGGGKLVEALKTIKNVVVCKYDRLWRDVDDARAVMRDWNKQGIALHIVDMGGQAVNTSTATGWIMFNMLLVFSEGERLIIGERTKQKLDYKRSRGEQLGGLCPYGYDSHVNGGGTKMLVPNEQEQLWIRSMVLARLAGQTLQQIANGLMREKIKTKCGTSVWTPRNVKAVIDRYNKEQ